MLPVEILLDLVKSPVSQQWLKNVPYEAWNRYGEIGKDIQVLRSSGLLPAKPQQIVELCSGSGAGSVVLLEQFPQSNIIAVDSAQTHQYGQYKVHVPPPPITFRPDSIQGFAQNYSGPPIDLIVAARMVFYSQTQYIDEQNKELAQAFLALSRHLSPQGTWAISSPWNDYQPAPGIFDIDLKTHDIFRTVSECRTNTWWDRPGAKTTQHPHTLEHRVKSITDIWYIMSGINREALDVFNLYPEEFVTETGNRHTLIASDCLNEQ